MKIVDFTKQISISPSFTKLTLRHIELQKDKISFPEPDKFNYDWSDPKNLMCQMMNQGYLLGKVLLDDNNDVQGYALYTYDKNPISNVLTLYVMAIIVAEEYVNSFWAGKLVNSVVNFATEHGCKTISWSVNTYTPGEEMFYKHPNKFKLISQTFLQILDN